MSMAPWVNSGHIENETFAAVMVSCSAMPTSPGNPPPPFSAGNGTPPHPAATNFW
jgi:hypothetical protein